MIFINMIKLSDVWVKNKKTGKKYDVKKPDPSKHDFAWDYRGSKENPNPFKKKTMKKEDVNVNDNDKAEMLSGIAQILSGVEDMGNRKELAKKEIIKLKEEGVEFDIKEFLMMCGFGGHMAGIENPSLTSEMSTNDIHFKGLLKIIVS